MPIQIFRPGKVRDGEQRVVMVVDSTIGPLISAKQAVQEIA